MALIAETTKDPYFPSHLSASAIDLIKRLLTRDQAARLVRQLQCIFSLEYRWCLTLG
jgi:hypothetical protein